MAPLSVTFPLFALLIFLVLSFSSEIHGIWSIIPDKKRTSRTHIRMVLVDNRNSFQTVHQSYSVKTFRLFFFHGCSPLDISNLG